MHFFLECLLQAGAIISEKDLTSSTVNLGSFNKLWTTRAVHLLAFFVLFYVGVEVTMGGTILAVVIQSKNIRFHTMQPHDVFSLLFYC